MYIVFKKSYIFFLFITIFSSSTVFADMSGEWICSTTINARLSIVGGVKKYSTTIGQASTKLPDVSSGNPYSLLSFPVVNKTFILSWLGAMSYDKQGIPNQVSGSFGGDFDQSGKVNLNQLAIMNIAATGANIASQYDQTCFPTYNKTTATGSIVISSGQLTGSINSRIPFSSCMTTGAKRLKVKRGGFSEINLNFSCNQWDYTLR